MNPLISELITKINEIDSAIKDNEILLMQDVSDKKDLEQILKNAQNSEREQSKKYLASPTMAAQNDLEISRNFTAASSERVKLFRTKSAGLSNDNLALYGQRKIYLDELVMYRHKDTHDELEDERNALYDRLYPDIVRLLLITNHLGFGTLLQLDLNRMFQKYFDGFNIKLESEKDKLTDYFERLS